MIDNDELLNEQFDRGYSKGELIGYNKGYKDAIEDLKETIKDEKNIDLFIIKAEKELE